MKKYIINQEQLSQIEHYKDMFKFHAEMIQGLCNSEKPDISYGFELGQVYTNLTNYYVEMMNLESEIRDQIIKD